MNENKERIERTKLKHASGGDLPKPSLRYDDGFYDEVGVIVHHSKFAPTAYTHIEFDTKANTWLEKPITLEAANELVRSYNILKERGEFEEAQIPII